MVFLGLGPDDEYDDDYLYDDEQLDLDRIDNENRRRRSSGLEARRSAALGGDVRTLRAVPDSDDDHGVTVRSTVAADSDSRSREPRPVATRARSKGPKVAKPVAVVPNSFADAKTIADEFRREVPVIMNLHGLDRELSRRMIDFASGVCYVLDGGMEKVANQVFLLIPDSVEVSDEERRRMQERGYD